VSGVVGIVGAILGKTPHPTNAPAQSGAGKVLTSGAVLKSFCRGSTAGYVCDKTELAPENKITSGKIKSFISCYLSLKEFLCMSKKW